MISNVRNTLDSASTFFSTLVLAFFVSAVLASVPSPAFSQESFATGTVESPAGDGSDVQALIPVPPVGIEVATDSVVPSATHSELFLKIYDEKMKECGETGITVDIMYYLLKNFNEVRDSFQQLSIQEVLGCRALELEDEAECDKFATLPEDIKAMIPWETNIQACKEKVATLKTMKNIFSGGECDSKMESYCRDINKCANQPAGKVCTCEMYATLWCGVVASKTLEACGELGEKMRGVLKGYDKSVVDKYAGATSGICQKAVLGVDPRENENDAGASYTIFLGGLFSGADWKIYKDSGSAEKFGVAPEFAYWFDYVYKNHNTCTTHLNIFKDDFCKTYSYAYAQEKERVEIEKAAAEKEKTGDKAAADKKDKKGKDGK